MARQGMEEKRGAKSKPMSSHMARDKPWKPAKRGMAEKDAKSCLPKPPERGKKRTQHVALHSSCQDKPAGETTTCQ
ncbi:hypothetical protein OIU85_010225 [Salix viminalis]|uniref:Uncharacterized protein n=1 Tax=Salix viminalis TaxID=40686 RepID=A0A9Q0NW46_SALVM|nr:hypothetical protein OIU85_010225 [Salix viminalis]